MNTHTRRLIGLGGAATLLAAAAVTLLMPDANAATLLSDTFESGNAGSWSKSGGDWSVVTDGSKTLQQADTGTDRAREFAGSSGWTDYSVQARVKALSFAGPGSVVALAARASGATKMYRLALTGGDSVRLQYMNGSSVTDLATLTRTVSAGTWYTLRIDVSGSTVSGSVDGVPVGSATNSAITAGRVGLYTGYASARFDDVQVSDSTVTPPSATSSPTGGTTPPSSPPPSNPPPVGGIVGWATQGGGTTGGAGGPSITVSTLDALSAAANSATTETIQVNGLFTCAADVRVAANKTIVGVGSGSGLVGCGLNIRGVSNVIVRNMNISKVKAGNGNGDAIHIDNATRLWIDHNDLSSDTSHGTDYYDGLLDITHGADYITVSWNRIHDHIKCSLVGHSDGNASEDSGHLRVTYHHNLFSNCAERNPRVRFANPVHVFNNYYVQTQSFSYSYGIATTMGAGVLVEGNYFENIAEPTHLHEGNSDPGNLVARNNTTVNSGPILTSGSVAPIPYAYTVDASGTVKSTVTAGAGTGRI